jgi:hypothetical protein
MDRAMMALDSVEQSVGSACNGEGCALGSGDRDQPDNLAGLVPPTAFLGPAIGQSNLIKGRW